MGQTVSVRLDDDTLKQLDTMAKAADRSRVWLMSHAVKQYVMHTAWQIEAIKKSLKKMAGDTARYVTNDDVADWLASWATDQEKACPKCG